MEVTSLFIHIIPLIFNICFPYNITFHMPPWVALKEHQWLRFFFQLFFPLFLFFSNYFSYSFIFFHFPLFFLIPLVFFIFSSSFSLLFYCFVFLNKTVRLFNSLTLKYNELRHGAGRVVSTLVWHFLGLCLILVFFLAYELYNDRIYAN